MGGYILRGAAFHRSEFQYLKVGLVDAYTGLMEEYRAGIVELDGQCNEQEHGRQHHNGTS